MAIKVTYKPRKKIDAEKLLNDLADEQLRHAREAVSLYEQTTETWADRGRFSADGTRYRVNIYMRGEMEGIYAGIDGGFMRQVAVTDDWISKTWPGQLRARPGRGHLLKHNGKPVLLQSPEPVIARHFTKMIGEMIKAGYLQGMKAVFERHVGAK